MPKLTIDGIEVEVEKGTSILQAAEQIGIEIPRFCYHDRLTVPANCRMCLVQVEGGPPKPQASCALACADNMVVHTNSEMVQKARKGVMEMLLINHPLDCPICDQGGECDLQDQAMAYGFDRTRYHENKRAVPDKNFGPLIKTSMNRCIQCTRCVRFGEEIAGMPQLGLINRGEDAEISTFIESAVATELSGNMIDVCPVGALTSKPYAFKARPWELRRTETIDVHDAVGSNIRVDSRGGEVMRVLPRLHEDVNEEWIGDRTRFSYDGLKRQRLDRPFIRDEGTGKLRPATWDEALALAARKLKSVAPDSVAALAGDLADVESVVALKDLMGRLGVKNLECRVDGSRYDASVRSGYLFNTGIGALETADAILLVGTFPRWEAAMINARIRKAYVNNRARIGVVGEVRDFNYPITHIANGPEGLQELLKDKNSFAKILAGAQRPAVIVGMGAFQREDGEGIHQLVRDVAEHFNVVRDGWNGFNMLHTGAGRVGALDVGFHSELDSFELHDMKLVYLLNVDEPIIMENINRKAFVIYQGHHGDLGASRADIVLPGAAFTEKNSLYVNTEGRVQQARKAVDPVGEAKEDWKILRALSGSADLTLPYDDQAALRGRIIREWPHLGRLDVLPSEPWKKFGKRQKPGAESFSSVVDNYYLTNVITRASATMADCSARFLNPLAQAAE